MRQDLKICLAAALAGGRIVKKYYGRKFKVRKKGEINLVTEVDFLAQEAICKIIRKIFPQDALLAEEGDLSKTQSAERRWIIDPLDGTTNFAHGYPRFCVSVALEVSGRLKCGIIYDPIMEEVFKAEAKSGAFLNGKRLQVTKTKKLKDALLVTGFPYDLNNPEYDNVGHFLRFLKKAQAVRRDGSAALNLAYVAAGRFDGFWEPGLNAWDVAAGVLLIREAGGIVTNFSGQNYQLKEHSIIASHKNLHRQLLKEVGKSWMS